MLDGTRPTSITDRRYAVELGVEALKRLREFDALPMMGKRKLLPGETIE